MKSQQKTSKQCDIIRIVTHMTGLSCVLSLKDSARLHNSQHLQMVSQNMQIVLHESKLLTWVLRRLLDVGPPLLTILDSLSINSININNINSFYPTHPMSTNYSLGSILPDLDSDDNFLTEFELQWRDISELPDFIHNTFKHAKSVTQVPCPNSDKIRLIAERPPGFNPMPMFAPTDMKPAARATVTPTKDESKQHDTKPPIALSCPLWRPTSALPPSLPPSPTSESGHDGS
jgi:hypothetical protein